MVEVMLSVKTRGVSCYKRGTFIILVSNNLHHISYFQQGVIAEVKSEMETAVLSRPFECS